jgi:gluconate 5-dehydrogenase
VRANCISPGPFSNTEDAEGQNSVSEDSPFVRRLKGYTVLNRIGRPIELCGALLFLASDASSYVTGQNFNIDGGWTAV